jgi:predicted permease
MLLKTLMALQSVETGFDTRHVLAINVPVMSYGKTPQQVIEFYQQTVRRIHDLPGVEAVAVGTMVPWRDSDFGFGLDFSADGHVRAPGEEDPRARFRVITPGFFAALGVPLIAGRDFNDGDRQGSEPVVIVSQSVAAQMFPKQDPLNRHIIWTDPVTKFIGISAVPRRIVGVAADVDDTNVAPEKSLSIYHPVGQQEVWGGRLFIHTHANPYTLVTPITRVIRGMATDQPVERAATLEDIRAEVLSPNRLNLLVFGGFAAVALLIALVGVAGVLAFSVSGRTREFGIRMAIGSQPSALVAGVIRQGAAMAGAGVVAGLVCGFAFARLAANYSNNIKMPGVMPVLGSALLLLVAAVIASVVPALRAARVDLLKALRAD